MVEATYGSGCEVEKFFCPGLEHGFHMAPDNGPPGVHPTSPHCGSSVRRKVVLSPDRGRAARVYEERREPREQKSQLTG